MSADAILYVYVSSKSWRK